MKLFRNLGAVICEDIRQEANGKFILGGVFAGGMNLGSIPGSVRIGVFAEIEPTDVGTFTVKFRVIDGRKAAIVEGEIQFDVKNRKPFGLTLGPIPMAITSVGTLAFQWRRGSEKWETLKSIDVAHDPRLLAGRLSVSNAVPPSEQFPPSAPVS